MKLLKTLTVFVLITLCFACSKEVAKQDTTFTIPVEEIIPDTRMCWDEFRALSLKEKLEFDLWRQTKLQLHVFKNYGDYRGWIDFGIGDFAPNWDYDTIHFSNFIPYKHKDSSIFRSFYDWDPLNSNYQIDENTIYYFKRVDEFGDSLNVKLNLYNDTILSLDVGSSRYFKSQKSQGGEPHYVKDRFLFTFNLSTHKINSECKM